VILNGAGTIYDPDFARAFIEMVGVYPAGSLLRLSDGDLVMVTRADEHGESPEVVLLQPAGDEILEQPIRTELGERAIVDQVLPSEVGIEPAALLEQVGVIVQPI
jgi:hypothetical protein